MAEVHLTQEPQDIPGLIKESEEVFKKHFGEWNSFKWMNEDKDKIPPHLDRGKGLLEAWLKEVDAKAQANVYARAEMPELQTEYRMQALDTAIQYFNNVKWSGQYPLFIGGHECRQLSDNFKQSEKSHCFK